MGGSSAWNDITGKPNGLVSSSVQATDWSVASASLAQNAISASYFLVSSSRFVPVASDGTLQGSIYYSNTRQALVYVTGDDSAIDIGFALHSRVYNATGVNIPKGTVLQYDGVFASGRVRVRPAIAPNINAPHPTIIGVAHEAIPNGEFGDAISEGILYNTNTAGFTEGNQLYLSTTASGSLTETAPGNEFHRISVATCVITQPSTGRLFVRV
jgi:predicted RecA/RadA family phage recombinase